MKIELDIWYSFECFQHDDSPSGLVFDVRLARSVPELGIASCPVCSAPCEMRSSWNATESGHGGLSTVCCLQAWDQRDYLVHRARIHGDEFAADLLQAGVSGQ